MLCSTRTLVAQLAGLPDETAVLFQAVERSPALPVLASSGIRGLCAGPAPFSHGYRQPTPVLVLRAALDAPAATVGGLREALAECAEQDWPVVVRCGAEDVARAVLETPAWRSFAPPAIVLHPPPGFPWVVAWEGEEAMWRRARPVEGAAGADTRARA
ncbi:MAG: hypothetical protein ACK4YP_21660 [Myxococcota bacterium]